MDYIEANLAPNEKVIARIQHSWAGLVSVIFWVIVTLTAAIVLVVLPTILDHRFAMNEDYERYRITVKMICYILSPIFFVAVIFIPVVGIMHMAACQLAVTNKRLFGRVGFIRKVTTDIVLNKIDTINVGNDLFGAIFHYGYIQLTSAASSTNKTTIKYNYVSNTVEFRNAVLEAIEQAKAEELEEQAKLMREAVQAEQAQSDTNATDAETQPTEEFSNKSNQ